ncbi:MAG: hypothetical protein BRC28_01945 [Nanohaloarchaea archaeon SW_4_43_9]|nr:MAG: hypothetical protein BRC28_01945 [Nanohaloarchaea archaeon SW_4_43_9]
MRKTFLSFVCILLVSSVSGQIEPEIRDECNNQEEPVISISDPQKLYSHPAEPGYYDNNLCVEGISDVVIQEERCEGTSGFHLSSREDNAHFSTFGGYRLNVCTGEMNTRITSKGDMCLANETELFSVSGPDNAHVGGPGLFDRLVCGSYAEPENITLEIEFNLTSDDDVYFDGEEVEGEQSFDSADYPAMVAEGDELTSGIVSDKMSSASRSIEGENVYVMKANSTSSDFIIPFTKGDRNNIQNREELIKENEFLEQIRPSFAYVLPENPEVRVIYDPEVDIDSNISYSPGRYNFEIVKEGENSVGIY